MSQKFKRHEEMPSCVSSATEDNGAFEVDRHYQHKKPAEKAKVDKQFDRSRKKSSFPVFYASD